MAQLQISSYKYDSQMILKWIFNNNKKWNEPIAKCFVETILK